MIPKFKVYYEAEVNGKKLRGIEECCSWFLLTQTGEIMIYGPCDAPVFPNKNYTKIIPLFYTGLKDKNGKEIYEGDIIGLFANTQVACVEWCDERLGYFVEISPSAGVEIGAECLGNLRNTIEVIGNIHDNPELLEGK